MRETALSRRTALTSFLCCACAVGSSVAAARIYQPGCVRYGGPGSVDGVAVTDDIWDGFRLIKDQRQYETLGLALNWMSRFFRRRASFGFYDDTDDPNSWASPQSKFANVKSTVGFGRRKFQEILKYYDKGDIMVLLITAHEFGHVAQFDSAIETRLPGREPEKSRRRELHADFLAGFYFAELRRVDPDISGDAAVQFLRDLGDIGPARGHGTASERVATANAGYQIGWDGGYTFDGAFERGMRMVLTEF